jgi:uncharacterized membrane protein YedE/YeeE
VTGRAVLAALAAGVLFGVGLLVAGMTMPGKVIGFLDVGGGWDPTLGFVMAGAIAVHAGLLRVVRGRRGPLFDHRFYPPPAARIDARLVGGAAVFGIGWGLSGYCPGPALVSLAAGAAPALLFVAAMILGMAIARRLR